MALEAAVARAHMAHIILGFGAISFVLALARRRHVKEWNARFAVSSRARKLVSPKTPLHIAEHVARLVNPDYICLAISENKITVGPLLRKVAEIRQRHANCVLPPITPRNGGYYPEAGVIGGGCGSEQTADKECRGHKNGVPTSAKDGSGASPSTHGTGSAGDPGAIEPESTINKPCSPSDLAQTGGGDGGGEAGGAGDCVDAGDQTKVGSSCALPNVPMEGRSSRKETIAVLGYDEPRGGKWVREQLAAYIGPLLMRRPVNCDNICIAAGCTAALRLLLLSITEEQEACLIPTPYFTGYDGVMAGTGVVPWPVGSGPDSGVDAAISPASLQQAYRSARSHSIHVRALLLCSPHNPTGRLYTARALLLAVDWARKRGIHIISEEVYANCVHRPGATFRGLGSLLGGGLGQDVHIIYGPGKDLGIAGWRVGAIYSENQEVLAMVGSMCHSCEASTDTLNLLGQLLREPGFMEEYVCHLREGLRKGYTSVVQELDQKGILYLPAEAGLFIMLDLREFLIEQTREAEQELWWEILTSAGVNLTPGEAMHCSEPGWFRLCFGYQEEAVVSRAVGLVADVLHRRARVAAGDFNPVDLPEPQQGQEDCQKDVEHCHPKQLQIQEERKDEKKGGEHGDCMGVGQAYSSTDGRTGPMPGTGAVAQPGNPLPLANKVDAAGGGGGGALFSNTRSRHFVQGEGKIDGEAPPEGGLSIPTVPGASATEDTAKETLQAPDTYLV